jgi:hypothetical protein
MASPSGPKSKRALLALMAVGLAAGALLIAGAVVLRLVSNQSNKDSVSDKTTALIDAWNAQSLDTRSKVCSDYRQGDFVQAAMTLSEITGQGLDPDLAGWFLDSTCP